MASLYQTPSPYAGYRSVGDYFASTANAPWKVERSESERQSLRDAALLDANRFAASQNTLHPIFRAQAAINPDPGATTRFGTIAGAPEAVTDYAKLSKQMQDYTTSMLDFNRYLKGAGEQFQAKLPAIEQEQQGTLQMLSPSRYAAEREDLLAEYKQRTGDQTARWEDVLSASDEELRANAQALSEMAGQQSSDIRKYGNRFAREAARMAGLPGGALGAGTAGSAAAAAAATRTMMPYLMRAGDVERSALENQGQVGRYLAEREGNFIANWLQPNERYALQMGQADVDTIRNYARAYLDLPLDQAQQMLAAQVQAGQLSQTHLAQVMSELENMYANKYGRYRPLAYSDYYYSTQPGEIGIPNAYAPANVPLPAPSMNVGNRFVPEDLTTAPAGTPNLGFVETQPALAQTETANRYGGVPYRPIPQQPRLPYYTPQGVTWGYPQT